MTANPFQIVEAATLRVLWAIVQAEIAGGSGAEKKTRAIAAVNAELPAQVPAWAVAVIDVGLSALIDFVVARWNASGFFGGWATSSPPGSSTKLPPASVAPHP